MKYLKTLLVGIVAVTALTSCGEKNLFNEERAQAYYQALFESNFIKRYGTVPPEYSWDASSAIPYWSQTTRAGDVEISYKIEDEYMEIESPILKYMKSNLVEQKDNRSKGATFFVMTVPDNPFTIVPFYQGNAGSVFDLYIEVEGVSKKLWSKGGDIQIFAQGYSKGDDGKWVADDSKSEWLNITSSSRMDQDMAVIYKGAAGNVLADKTNADGEVITAESQAAVKLVPTKAANLRARSRQYTLDLSEYAGRKMTFFLKITTGSSPHSTTGDIQSSVDGYIVNLANSPLPSNLPEGAKEVMIIGCESANNKLGSEPDWDLNELVFLLYGTPKLPIVAEITDDMVDQVVEKRYMCEDLGDTDDIDFNDVVVDLRDIRSYKIEYVNGVQTGEELVSHRQEAIIRHLGGTIPFDVKLTNGGKTTSIYSGDGKGFQTSPNVLIDLGEQSTPSETFDGLLWNPAENNVVLTTRHASNDGMMEEFSITFPDKGSAAPLIIATDTDVDWMEERVPITREWFERINANLNK